MPENTNQQKAITLESMAEVAPLLAMKEDLAAEVKKQIEELPEAGGMFEFATTEEVLALFQGTASDTGGE